MLGRWQVVFNKHNSNDVCRMAGNAVWAATSAFWPVTFKIKTTGEDIILTTL